MSFADSPLLSTIFFPSGIAAVEFGHSRSTAMREGVSEESLASPKMVRTGILKRSQWMQKYLRMLAIYGGKSIATIHTWRGIPFETLPASSGRFHWWPFLIVSGALAAYSGRIHLQTVFIIWEPLVIWCGRIQNRLHIFVLSRMLDMQTSSVRGGFCGTGTSSAHSFTMG